MAIEGEIGFETKDDAIMFINGLMETFDITKDEIGF